MTTATSAIAASSAQPSRAAGQAWRRTQTPTQGPTSSGGTTCNAMPSTAAQGGPSREASAPPPAMKIKLRPTGMLQVRMRARAQGVLNTGQRR